MVGNRLHDHACSAVGPTDNLLCDWMYLLVEVASRQVFFPCIDSKSYDQVSRCSHHSVNGSGGPTAFLNAPWFVHCVLSFAHRARAGRPGTHPAKVLVAIVRRSPSQEAAPLSRRTTTPFHNIPFPSSWAAMLVFRRHSQTTRPTCLAGLRGLDWKGGELATPMCHSSWRSNREGGRVVRTKG